MLPRTNEGEKEKETERMACADLRVCGGVVLGRKDDCLQGVWSVNDNCYPVELDLEFASCANVTVRCLTGPVLAVKNQVRMLYCKCWVVIPRVAFTAPVDFINKNIRYFQSTVSCEQL